MEGFKEIDLKKQLEMEMEEVIEKSKKLTQSLRAYQMEESIGNYYHYKAAVAVAKAILDTEYGDEVPNVIQFSNDICTNLNSNGHTLKLNTHPPMKKNDDI